jgi:DNA repair photolyase
VLRVELKHLRLRETVALGTATDPYQPIEGKYRLSRRSLEVLCTSPLPLVVVTKGSLVVRDIDLFVRLGRLVPVRVCLSIPSVDADVASRAEPGAAPPRARLEAVRRLRAAGIDAGVLAAPILPGISDSEASLEAVAAAAREHDASFFHHRPLKLDPGVRPHYFAMIAEHFPTLAGPTTERFAGRVNQDPRYVDELERRVERVRSRHGFFEPRQRTESAARPPSRAPEPVQIRLAI